MILILLESIRSKWFWLKFIAGFTWRLLFVRCEWVTTKSSCRAYIQHFKSVITEVSCRQQAVRQLTWFRNRSTENVCKHYGSWERFSANHLCWRWMGTKAYTSNQQPVVLVQGKRTSHIGQLFLCSWCLNGNSEDELYLGLFALCLLFDAWDHFECDGTLRLGL